LNSVPGGEVTGGAVDGFTVGGGTVGGSPMFGGMGNAVPVARVFLNVVKIGFAPFPQRFLKSSVSSDQTIPPANPIAIAYLACNNKYD